MANESELDEIAALICEVFWENPIYNGIFQYKNNDPMKKKAFDWFFGKRVKILHSLGNRMIVARLISSGEIVASVTLIEKNRRATLGTLLRFGLLKWPFLWGFESLRRVLQVDKAFSGDIVQSGKVKFEVGMNVVKAAYQGKGLGSAMYQKLLDHSYEISGERYPGIILETQEEINVRFYAKQGMRLQSCGEFTLDGFQPFHSWRMENFPENDKISQ